MLQAKYIDNILKRFEMQNAKSVSIILDPNIKLSKAVRNRL